MSAHARLSASSADRWMRCPASVSLSAGVVDKSSIYAQYGTVLHDIASFCLLEGHEPTSILSHEEDIAPVREYLRVARLETKAHDLSWIEMRLEALTRIDPDLGGTADYVRFGTASRELLVIEFKTGSGVNVEAMDNRQMRICALGALVQKDLSRVTRTVRVAVVQPRLADPALRYKDWTFEVMDLLAFGRELQVAAVATRSKAPLVVPGEAQCRWCPAGEAGLCAVRVKFKPRRVAASKVTEDDVVVVEPNKPHP